MDLGKIKKNISKHIPPYYYYGQEFRNLYNEVQQNQFKSRKVIEEYQFRKLRSLLQYAGQYVPYYMRLFKAIDFNVDKFDSLDQFKQIPLLEKKTVQENPKDFLSSLYTMDKLEARYSGGSTGIPAEYYSEKKIHSMQVWAFMYNQWSRCGYDCKRAYRIARYRRMLPKSGLYEIIGNDLIFSNETINCSDIEPYVRVLEKFNPDFLHIYPSILDAWADKIIGQGLSIKLPKLKAILCGSEKIYDYQREKLESLFGVRCYSWYGHSEGGCMAGECEVSHKYHIFPDFGYTEIINKDGENIIGQDGEGEIVTTGFLNRAMPLIRFRTSDIALSVKEECKCGRNSYILQTIVGRIQDYLIDSKSNRKSAGMLLGYGLVSLFNNVNQYQIVQRVIGEIEFLIVRRAGYTDIDEERIMTEMAKELGKDMVIKIKYVDDIPRTKSGKFMYVRSEIAH